MYHVVPEKHNKLLQGRSLRNNKPEDKFTYKRCSYYFQDSYFSIMFKCKIFFQNYFKY